MAKNKHMNYHDDKMSKDEHREHHCSDGQRHAEGRYKIEHEEKHDSFANERKYHGK